MTKRQGLAVVLLLALTHAAHAVGEHQSSGKQNSPRATVQTLFAAVGGARQKPGIIKDAVACLDLAGLPADQIDPDRLAIQLESVLRAADVNTEALPEENGGDVYTLSGAEGNRIGLRRQPDGRWLFDRETVAMIPKLAAIARKVLQDKNREAATLNVAPEVASPRAAFRTFLSAYSRGDNERILKCMNLNDVPSAARQEVGEQLAHKLIQVIFRNRPVIYQDIPDSNYSDTFSWLSLPEGSIELSRHPTGEHKGEWVFSRQTIRSVDSLHNLFEGRPYHESQLSIPLDKLRPDVWRAPELWLRGRLPDWAKANLTPSLTVRVEPYQLAGCAVLLALIFGLIRLGVWMVSFVIHHSLVIAGWRLPHGAVGKRLRPCGYLLACVVLRSGVLMLDLDKTLTGWALTVLNPLAWVLGTWAIFRLMDLIGDISEIRMADSKHRIEITEMLWPVGSLATKILLGMALVLHMMTLFAWDVTAVLTGLGIGGVAFALGAQDSLRNFFGSFTLLADRPFVVGETVQIGEQGQGVVERVGLRSTSIRTVDDTLIVVPNSNLTTMNITNFGRRRFRRFTGRIGVVYGTPPERLAAFRDGIRQLILSEKFTRKENFEVAIHDLSASAIEMEVSLYFDVTTRHEEMAAREQLLLGFLRVAEELQVGLAVPTQTVHPLPDHEAASVILHTPADQEAKAPIRATA